MLSGMEMVTLTDNQNAELEVREMRIGRIVSWGVTCVYIINSACHKFEPTDTINSWFVKEIYTFQFTS